MRKIEWDGFAREKASKEELEAALSEIECSREFLRDRESRLRQSLQAYDKDNG